MPKCDPVTANKLAAVRAIRKLVPNGRVSAKIKQQILAKYPDANPTSIQQGLVIIDNAVPEVLEAVYAGKMTFNLAQNIAKIKSKEEQRLKLQDIMYGGQLPSTAIDILRSSVVIPATTYAQLTDMLIALKANCSKSFVDNAIVIRLTTQVLNLFDKINDGALNKHIIAITQKEEETNADI